MAKPNRYRIPLNLTLIAPILHESALEEIEVGNVSGFLGKSEYGNQHTLTIVHQNIDALKERGLYEKALIDAFIDSRTNNHQWPARELEALFQFADRERLRAAGNRLPNPGPFTLYRGVAGRAPSRRVRGLSWTSSFDRAKWFAQRWPELGDPAVYRAIVAEEDVLFYTNDRNEEEYVVHLRASYRPRLVWSPGSDNYQKIL